MSRTRLLSAPRSFLFSAGEHRPVSGIRLGFARIAGKETGGGSCHSESSYFMDVTDISDRRLMITFHNRGGASCVITDIYFSDGGLFSISVQSVKDAGERKGPACQLVAAGVASGVAVPELYDDSGNFRVVNSIPKGPEAEVMLDGIHRNESLGIVFDLQAGVTLADVISALSSGKLTISIKLHGSVQEDTALLINESTLYLKPAK